MKYMIIDGSNLVRRIYGFDAEEAKKEGYRTDAANSALFVSIFKRFLKRCPKLSTFCNKSNNFVEVYFDGKPRDIYSSWAGAVVCLCSGRKTSDEQILARIAGMSPLDRRQVLLLTFDRNLAAQARGLSAHTINPAKIIEKISQFGLDLYAYV